MGGYLVTLRSVRARSTFVVVALLVMMVPRMEAVADSACWTYSKAERKFARLTNEARTAIGLRKLRLDPELSRVARKHTQEMVDFGDLYHTPASVLGKRVTRWKKLGENVGRGGDVSAIQTAFINSAVHEANILKPGYRHVGIGTKRANGYLWVTVVFEARKDPGTTLSMPKC